MVVSLQNASSSAELRPIEGSARALLRYVDRAALDELTAAFIEAVGLPAAVLSPSGEFIAGARTGCPACEPNAQMSSVPGSTARHLNSGWHRCSHGLERMIVPINARTGEQLAAVAIGPLALSDADLVILRRALVGSGETEKGARAHLGSIERSTHARAEAAARLLAQTFGAVVREAAIASENADLVATQRQANRELTVLYSVVRALGSGIELRAILQRLVDAVGEMLDSDVALVGLIEDDDLVTIASSGLLTFEARNGRLRVGEGLAGRVAATGQPLTCRDMQEDPRQYLTAINSREQLHAFAGVPLTLQGETVGVLAVYRRIPHAIPESELQLLAHIADQAAVAIERTRLYEQERRTIGELRTLHGQIERQHQALERATAVHDQLTQMVLQDTGLDAIVDSLALLLESTVQVEDQFHHLLARSPRQSSRVAPGHGLDDMTQTAAAVLEDKELQRLFETVRESRRPVSFPSAPALGFEHSRLVAPVIVGGYLLGFLSVVERDRPLEEPDLLAMGHATTVIALEMMKQRTRAEVERRLRGELLEELVAGKLQDPEAVQRRAAYLGYNLATPYALLHIDKEDPDEKSSGTTPREKQLSLAGIVEELIGKRANGSMALSRVDGTVVAIPLCEGSMSEARDVAESLKRAATRIGNGRILVAIGRICRSPEDFSVASVEAKRAITLAKSLGTVDRVVAFEDLGVYRLLIDLPRPSDAVRFAEELLAPLSDYDARHDTSLMETLEAYLASNGALQRTAAALSVHVNTLGYRLQRIRELTEIDLNDGDARLGLHLAVKIRQAISLSLGEDSQ